MKKTIKTAVSLIALIVASMSSHAQDMRVIKADAKFPEGPIFIDQKLYFVETGSDQVTVWDGQSNKTIFEQKGCGPNAVIEFQGDILVACYFSNSVVRITTQGKVVGTIDKASDGSIITGPNDLASDHHGGVYVTASGPWEPDPIVGKVFHIDAQMNAVEVADDISYANGIVMSQDGKRLLVGEPEANGRIISFAVGEDGKLTDRRTFIRLTKDDPGAGPDAYPDGIKWGPDGHLYVAEYSSGRVAVFSSAGKFIKAYSIPTQGVSNVTFSPDGTKMYAMAIDDKDKAPWPGKVYEIVLSQ